MNPFLQKLLTEGKDTVPALLKRLRGEAIEPEVVGDLATIAKKKVLADVPGELVGQKLLSAPVQQALPTSIASNVDDVLEEVVPFTKEKKGLMDHFNDLSSTKKTGLAVAAGGAALAPFMSDESNEFNFSQIDRTAKTPVKAEQNPQQAVTTKSSVSGKKSVVDNALQNQAPEIQSLSSQEDTLNRELEEARQKDADQGLLYGLLKAAQTGGAAIAGSKADTSFADDQLKKDDRFVERLKVDKEYKEQAEKRDPNSQISKLMQQSILALKPGANVEGLSAAQVEKIFPSLAQAINMQEAILSRKEQAQLNREEMALRRAEKAEKDKEKGSDTARTSVDKMVTNLQKSKAYEGYEATKSAQMALDNAIAKGDKTTIGSAFMMYAKIAQGDNSVVRESDMKNLAGSYNYTSPSEMFAKLNAKAEGGNFTPTELQQMKQVAALIEKVKGEQVRKLVNPIKNRIEGAGLNSDEIIDRSLIQEFSGDSTENSTTIDKRQLSPVKIMRLSDGKTMTLSPEAASKYLNNPKFQQVK